MLRTRSTAGVLLIALLLTSVAAHILLLLDSLPLLLTSASVLIIAVLVPGAALLFALFGSEQTQPTTLESALYSIAAGFCLATVTMLLLSYLPGAVDGRLTLLAFDALTLLLLFVGWLRLRSASQTNGANASSAASAAPAYPRWFWAALALCVLLAGALRLTHLGYAEFHGDEARAVLRAAGVMQGYEETLFLHKKGPGEILSPALQFALGQRIDEGAARLPFALASLAGMLAVAALGVRLMGPIAGIAAAFLVALDGYLVAFARFVQYQSVVLLLTSLAVLLLVYAYRRPAQLHRSLALAALFMTTALLYHYDAAAALFPLIFLWVKIGADRRVPWLRLLRATILPALIGIIGLGLFYLPYVLHPHFAATSSYLVGSRVGPSGLPYNNVQDVFLRSSLYSSAYYVLTMLVLLGAAAYLALRRGWRPAAANWVAGAALLLLIPLFWRPAWLLPAADLYVLSLVAALLILIWLAPRLSVGERMLWLWLGAPLVVALFLIATPKTHIHVVVVPWTLLAGGVIEAAGRALSARRSTRVATLAGAGLAVVLGLLFGRYIWWLTVQHETEALLAWKEAPPAGYWTPFVTPESDSLYGFPFANGWKVVHELYEQGEISGHFETNQWFEWIPDWYTRGRHRCAATAEWYFAIDNPEPWSERSAAIADRLQAEGFRTWGVVTVNDRPGMTIYRRGGPEDEAVRTLALEDYAPAFDTAAGADLPLSYPSVDPEIGMPLGANLGDLAVLEGYTLETDGAIQPGDTIRLTLVWRARQPNLPRYKVTVQAYDADGRKAAQKDAYSVCDRLPTSEWPPGELIEDIYDIRIREEIPAGVYPLYVALYDEETLTRVPRLDDGGNVVDDKAHIVDLEIGPPNGDGG